MSIILSSLQVELFMKTLPLQGLSFTYCSSIKDSKWRNVRRKKQTLGDQKHQDNEIKSSPPIICVTHPPTNFSNIPPMDRVRQKYTKF